VSWVLLLILFLLCEVIVAYGFSQVARIFYRQLGWDLKSIAKGVIERIFLVICLSQGFPHGLTLFGALKLGTRIRQKDDSPGFNDYYLMGNLISVSIAIGYVAFLQDVENSWVFRFFDG